MANPDVGLAEGKEEKANSKLQGLGGGAQALNHGSPAAISAPWVGSGTRLDRTGPTLVSAPSLAR